MRNLVILILFLVIPVSLAANADDKTVVCRGGPMIIKVFKSKIHGIISDTDAVESKVTFRKGQVRGTRAVSLQPGECTLMNRLFRNDEPRYFWFRRAGKVSHIQWMADSHGIMSFNLGFSPFYLQELLRDAGDKNRYLHLRLSEYHRVEEVRVSERSSGRQVRSVLRLRLPPGNDRIARVGQGGGRLSP